ncbi:MAG: hypothetical protein M5R41_10405 [Bacteroidia bacterium]|nr:hypothetical protein [Bacteroidia bacterium]
MRSDFGHLDESFSQLAEDLRLRALYSHAAPWSAAEGARTAVEERRRAAKAPGGFWKFDQWYFPPEAYDGQYARPNKHFHGAVVAATEKTGRECTLILGPHDHAKSAFVYKRIVHALVTGERHFIGLVSETLDTPRSIVAAIAGFIQRNERLRHDYPDIELLTASAEELCVRTRDSRQSWIKCFSEWRSPRGRNVDFFQRFDLICVEDLENQMSALDEDAVLRRRRKLGEYQAALAEDGCLVMTANNFAEECVANRMLAEYRAGTLDASWTVHCFVAWKDAGDGSSNRRTGPLWPERFPASSEAELRGLLKPMDDDTWEGSFQQRPRKPTGFYFLSQHYAEWNGLPADLVALVWCDPNLALKSQGDTTAMHALAYSRATARKYVLYPRCRSFGDSNELLAAYMRIVAQLYDNRMPVTALGFDGNVSQESHWTNHLRNYAREARIPTPRIEFRKYSVSDIAKNTQMEFNRGGFLFPPGFAKTEEGIRYTAQLWSFSGKKRSGRKDDAPDALICANEFLYDLGYGSRPVGASEYHSVRKRRLGPLDKF